MSKKPNFIDQMDANALADILCRSDEFLKALKDQIEQAEPEMSYVYAYRYFVEFFAKKENLTKEDVVIGANFTYGWMPTIITHKVQNFDIDLEGVTQVLNQLKGVKSSAQFDSSAAKQVTSFVNNSLVGTSKLLHFINPDVFPIWDSRVYLFLKKAAGQGSSQNQNHIQSLEFYASYIELCNNCLNEQGADNLINNYRQIVGYDASGLRVIEHLMFTLSRE